MRGFTRFISGLLIVSFLSWTGLQSFHAHPADAGLKEDCQVCKIAHQTPALVNPPAAPTLTLNPLFLNLSATPPSGQRVVIQLHGLAPPLL
jgi:hypothetical protein